MPSIAGYLENVSQFDQNFIGTVAFRSEELTLPDGSKMALGIDGGYWVLIYQEKIGANFQTFEYDQHKKKIFLDKKVGGADMLRAFKQKVNYFFTSARVDELVTILPPSHKGEI